VEEASTRFCGAGVTFQSSEEAIEVMAEVRADLVRRAAPVAVVLAKTRGVIQAQDVLQEMERQGLLTEAEKALSQRWIAVLFVGKEHRDKWEKVGARKIGNTTRNVHGAPRTVWRLAGSTGKAEPVVEITSFTGKHAFLSNKHPSKVLYRGRQWGTVAQAYEAAKKAERDEDWLTLRTRVMVELLAQKFALHPELRAALLSTGKDKIVVGRGKNKMGRILEDIRERLR